MENKKEILIGTLGTSPQVITELLYYYSNPYYKNLRVFDKIIFFTTKDGKECSTKLFKDNIVSNLQKELLKYNDKEKVKFNLKESDIVVLKDSNGTELDDVRMSEESFQSMNGIFDTMRKYSVNDKWRITATIVGGRKSMSTMMSTCFQMLAREEDELVHIIAPNHIMYNSNIAWFYPSDPSDPKQKLDLSIVPTIKINNFLPFTNDGTFIDLYEQFNKISKSKEVPVKTIIIDKDTFTIDNYKFKLKPLFASYIRYFIRKRIESECFKSCNGCSKCFSNYDEIMLASQNEILEEHEMITSEENQHYILRRDKIKLFDINNQRLASDGRGYKGLHLRNRSDLSYANNAIKKLKDIPYKIKSYLEIKTIQMDSIDMWGDEKPMKCKGSIISPKTSVTINE